MKPCRRFRKALALLALENGAVDRLIHDPLVREHVQRCAGCRNYWAGITQLTGHIEGDARKQGNQTSASARLHHKIICALRAEDNAGRESVQPYLRRVGIRVALPVMAACAVLTVVVVGVFGPRDQPMLNEAHTRPVAVNSLPAPRASEYLIAADRSLDEVDDLLTRQARQNLPPVAPIQIINVLGVEGVR